MNNNRRDAPSSLDPARKRGISNDCARSPTQQFSLTRGGEMISLCRTKLIIGKNPTQAED